MNMFASAVVAALVASTATAATLDFEGDICGGPCSDGSSISQSYADLAEIAVVYGSGPGAPTNFPDWSTAYSDLRDIAYLRATTGGATAASLSFVPIGTLAPGEVVKVSSLDLGAWPNTDRALGFRIRDIGDDALLFDTGLVTVLGTVASSFFPNVSSADGLRIEFFGDFFNGGVDNIVYSAGPAAVVPLPAGGLLLLSALGGAGLLARRRPRQAV